MTRMKPLDVVFACDARFPGGTSQAVATEMNAMWRAGFDTGFLQINGTVIKQQRPFHPGIRQIIDDRKTTWLDETSAIRCSLLLIQHPTLFSRALEERMNIVPERIVIVAHHPPINGAKIQQYNIQAQVDAILETFGVLPQIAPVGPAVRELFRTLPLGDAVLTPFDWHNLIDMDEWPYHPPRFRGGPTIIGRHSRPDKLKWPETKDRILAAYPANGDFKVRILGAGSFLKELLLEPLPPNWECIPFGQVEPQAFLATLDVYVYFHSSAWIEAFGRNVLEALATGLPTIIPRSFEALFGQAAFYAEAEEVKATLARFRQDFDGLSIHCRQARSFVGDTFSSNLLARRLADQFDLRPRRTKPNRHRGSVVGQRRASTVMFVTSNGVGLGHLTRQMAVAKRLPQCLIPVFYTLSGGAFLAHQAGYLVEHSPSSNYLGADPEQWNRIFADELTEAIFFHRPASLVFDGNVPYQGLLDAMEQFPDLRTAWVRRAMWRDHHGSVLNRSVAFDMVIEPGELARREDRGPTTGHRHQVVEVAPVLLIRPDQRLSRDHARTKLRLADKGQLVVALQLGAGNDFDFSQIRHALLSQLLAREHTSVVEIVSPLSESRGKPSPLRAHHTINAFPVFLYSNAFDCMISAAGYNTFHENILGAIPTLFVPNMADEMDRQDLRARFAERGGIGLHLHPRDIYGAAGKVDELLDRSVRTRIRHQATRIASNVGDGGAQIARIIEEGVYSMRTLPT